MKNAHVTAADVFQSLPFSVTVCDPDGILIAMNRHAEQMFANDGGRSLLGRSVFDCHPQAAQEKLKELIRDRKNNIYTVEKAGKKQLICQSPWYQDGEYAGFMEMCLELPENLPNVIHK